MCLVFLTIHTLNAFLSFQVRIVRAGNHCLLPGPIISLLRANGRVARLGRRPVPRARSKRHRPLRGSLLVLPRVPLPLASAPHEDPRHQPARGGLGYGALGCYCTRDGAKEGLYYAVIGADMRTHARHQPGVMCLLITMQLRFHSSTVSVS